MAELREITIAELRQLLQNHTLFLESNGLQGDRADLSNVNLRGLTFREQDLRDANLDGANLDDADLSGAKLQGARLQGAHLRRANLRNAILLDADLRDADLRDADLQDAIIQRTDLQNALFRFSDLKKTKSYKDIILNGGHLESAQFDSESLLRKELADAERRERQLNQKLNSISRELELASKNSQQAIKLKEEMENIEAERKQVSDNASDLQHKLEAEEKKTTELRAQNAALMNTAIENAVSEMRNSVEAARKTKDFNFWLSLGFIGMGVLCYIAAISFLIYLFTSNTCVNVLGLVDHGESVVHNAWQLIPLYLPVIALLSIGTAFFRHESKIRNQTSFLLEQISHAEIAAGLLKIATKLETIPDEKLERIIHPTFIDIRRSLLNMPASALPKEEKDEHPSLTQYKAMADVASKGIKLGVDKG